MDSSLADLLGPRSFFLRRDALALGMDDRVLRQLVRGGELRRVRHGAYTRRAHWDGLDAAQQHLLRARCIVRTAGADVALSHVSAAVALGAPVWGVPLDDVHLVRTDGRAGRREAGVRQHRQVVLPSDLVEVDGLPVTSATRTCLDVSAAYGVEAALVVVDHLLHVQGTTEGALAARLGELERTPGSLTARLVVALADGRSESVGETRLRYRCRAGGLPPGVPQYEIVRDGRVLFRLDLAWPAYGIWIEFDGRQKYSAFLRPGESVVDMVLREKKREEQIASLTGWRCLRVTWADLARPDELVARIAAVLNGGPVHV